MINSKVARAILQKLGYRVDSVQNGIEALRALEKIEYDLILMDVQMPEMDGFQATKKIRDRERDRQEESRGSKGIPIIAMTAHAMDGDRERCLAAGMDDYVSKPINRLDLENTLEKWLAKDDSG